jgi:hypothetical protein
MHFRCRTPFEIPDLIRSAIRLPSKIDTSGRQSRLNKLLLIFTVHINEATGLRSIAAFTTEPPSYPSACKHKGKQGHFISEVIFMYRFNIFLTQLSTDISGWSLAIVFISTEASDLLKWRQTDPWT